MKTSARQGVRGHGSPDREQLLLKLATAVWVTVLVAVGLKLALWPKAHTVFPIYTRAARAWLAGTDLYSWGNSFESYRYSPVVAIFLIPFSLLPDFLGALLWRLFCLGGFLGGLVAMGRTVFPRRWSAGEIALLFLLVAPLSLDNLGNGQCNALLAGLLMLGAAAAAKRRWWWAAGLIAVACLLKIYPVALALLLALLYPKEFSWRWAVCLLLGLVLPFALQRPAYVLGQYTQLVQHLRSDGYRDEAPLLLGYRDLRFLLRTWGVPISLGFYEAVQLMTAAGVAGTVVWMRIRKRPEGAVLALTVALACGWMVLCGPATETKTYVILAPAIAWMLVENWRERRRTVWQMALGGSYLLLLASALAGVLPTAARDQVALSGIQPFAALLFLCGALASAFAGDGGVVHPEAVHEAGDGVRASALDYLSQTTGHNERQL